MSALRRAPSARDSARRGARAARSPVAGIRRRRVRAARRRRRAHRRPRRRALPRVRGRRARARRRRRRPPLAGAGRVRRGRRGHRRRTCSRTARRRALAALAGGVAGGALGRHRRDAHSRACRARASQPRRGSSRGSSRSRCSRCTWLLGGSQGIVVTGGPTAGPALRARARPDAASLRSATSRSPARRSACGSRRRASASRRRSRSACRSSGCARLAVAASGDGRRRRGRARGAARRRRRPVAATARSSRSGSSSSCCSAARSRRSARRPGCSCSASSRSRPTRSARLEHVAAARAHTLLTAVMLLGIVSLGWDGIVRPGRGGRRGVPGAGPARVHAATLEATRRSASRSSSVAAADDVSLTRRARTDHGARRPERLRQDDGAADARRRRSRPTRDASTRAAGAVARTLQSTAVFPTLTPLEHVLVASAGRRARGGLVRSLFATPQGARRGRGVRRRTRAGCSTGSASRTTSPAGELPVSDQRALMLAAAYATGASVLLVDEPTAGASAAEAGRDDRAPALAARRRASRCSSSSTTSASSGASPTGSSCSTPVA